MLFSGVILDMWRTNIAMYRYYKKILRFNTLVTSTTKSIGQVWGGNVGRFYSDRAGGNLTGGAVNFGGGVGGAAKNKSTASREKVRGA